MNEITIFELATAYQAGIISWPEYIKLLHFYRKLPGYIHPVDYLAEEGQA